MKVSRDRMEIASAHVSTLGEGPVWDAERSALCWVDIVSGHIHTLQTATERLATIDVLQMVGCAALCRDGNYIAGLQQGIAFVNRNTGAISLIATPEAHLPGNRFNDGKCDPAGRLWVGSMALSEETGAGSLYCVDNDLQCQKKIDNVTTSNGMAWTSDHKTFYYIDSPTRTVVGYDYNMETGDIANRRVVIVIPTNEGFPDGMAIDGEDNLWIAHWDGWQVSRWDPRTGKKLLTVELPAARITSCAFGGPALEDLYITSARIHLTEEELKQQPQAGMLFVLRNSGYQGVKTSYFNYP
jgi:sugar lactone lactonase YvrE